MIQQPSTLTSQKALPYHKEPTMETSAPMGSPRCRSQYLRSGSLRLRAVGGLPYAVRRFDRLAVHKHAQPNQDDTFDSMDSLAEQPDNGFTSSATESMLCRRRSRINSKTQIINAEAPAHPISPRICSQGERERQTCAQIPARLTLSVGCTS